MLRLYQGHVRHWTTCSAHWTTRSRVPLCHKADYGARFKNPHQVLATEKPRRSEAFQARKRRLLVHRDFDNFLLDGISHELCLVVDVQFSHQVEFMCLDGLYA